MIGTSYSERGVIEAPDFYTGEDFRFPVDAIMPAAVPTVVGAVIVVVRNITGS
jgi:hypothetical protein